VCRLVGRTPEVDEHFNDRRATTSINHVMVRKTNVTMVVVGNFTEKSSNFGKIFLGFVNEAGSGCWKSSRDRQKH
jgi:hypothetical protein